MSSKLKGISRHSKSTGNTRTGHAGPEVEQRYSSTLSLTSALDGVGAQRHAPVPIGQEAVWATGPVRTGAKNLAPTWIRSPDRPARWESLYRLRYSGISRQILKKKKKKKKINKTY
jgi:hypothetical protein